MLSMKLKVHIIKVPNLSNYQTTKVSKEIKLSKPKLK